MTLKDILTESGNKYAAKNPAHGQSKPKLASRWANGIELQEMGQDSVVKEGRIVLFLIRKQNS